MTINNSVNAATASQSFGGAVSFSNASVTMSALASGTTANVVYYGAGGILTQGGFTAFSTSSNFTITGTWAFNGGFGVNSASSIPISSSHASGISLTASAGPLNLSGSTGIFMPSLASAATSFVVLYNSGTGQLSQSAYTAFSLSSNYVLTGSWTHNGPTFNVSATATMGLLSVSGINLTSSSSNIQLVASSGFINLTSPLITATSITSATTAEVLYWNSGTGSITHGAVPTGLTPVVVSGTSQAMVAGNRYIINSAGNAVALSLPASIAAGGEIEVVWQAATSWTISQQTGQAVRFGAAVSTTGVGGSVASNTAGDSIRLICTVANTSFTAVSAVGNLDIV